VVIIAARQFGPLLAQPFFQIGDQGRAQFLPNRPALLGALAIDRAFDVKQGVNAVNRLQCRGEIGLAVLPCALRRALAATSARMKNGRRAWTQHAASTNRPGLRSASYSLV
jgi:hypothetical protein